MDQRPTPIHQPHDGETERVDQPPAPIDEAIGAAAAGATDDLDEDDPDLDARIATIVRSHLAKLDPLDPQLTDKCAAILAEVIVTSMATGLRFRVPLVADMRAHVFRVADVRDILARRAAA